jgi:restriction endonuclease
VVAFAALESLVARTRQEIELLDSLDFSVEMETGTGKTYV